LVAAVALGNHLYAISAPPLARTVEVIEKKPHVLDAIGSPASVSLTSTRRLRRNILHAISGNDLVSVLSTVKGPKGEATFHLDARNENGQGWAGTFVVESQGRSVLKDGNYVPEGAGILVEGDFAPDGIPRIKQPLAK
jgi:hypothetical protein